MRNLHCWSPVFAPPCWPTWPPTQPSFGAVVPLRPSTGRDTNDNNGTPEENINHLQVGNPRNNMTSRGTHSLPPPLAQQAMPLVSPPLLLFFDAPMRSTRSERAAMASSYRLHGPSQNTKDLAPVVTVCMKKADYFHAKFTYFSS